MMSVDDGEMPMSPITGLGCICGNAPDKTQSVDLHR